MPGRVLADTGPLVALFDRNDQYHSQAVAFLQRFTGEVVSTLAIVAEVCWLLDFSVRTQTDFLRWVSRGALTVVELEPADFDRMIELMQKYADLPMDFADATLVALAERLGVRDVASIDRDFTIYRYRNRLHFRNIFLEE